MSWKSFYKNHQRNILGTALLGASFSTLYFLLARQGFMVPFTAIPEVQCVTGCPSQQALHVPPIGKELLNYNKPLSQLINSANVKEKTSILIEKSKYRLTVYYNQKPLKSYPVVFGGTPTGDKLQQGDNRTPEGMLRIKDLYPHPQWSKFLWLDYPNPQSWRKHFQAKTQGKIAWYQPIGGEVGIHGVPQGGDTMIDDRKNWTLGCPSLKNKDVEELYQVVQKGTLVEIVP
ncbi:murein L,D-transpeptidase family protein [Scytonema sp. NUACC26]|uniref:L,D-transpeptidase family protein n=1 Tax=Scytonema sp. NUACC26 TaxID=3140176 RepID=UPI0034DBE381